MKATQDSGWLPVAMPAGSPAQVEHLDQPAGSVVQLHTTARTATAKGGGVRGCGAMELP